MILFRHTTFDATSIGANLGMPEYSYYFVQKAFADVMARVGEVRTLADPELELDAAAAQARAEGQECAFLSFNPPQYVPLGRDCPTIPVFAWEYDRIPDESWTANPQDDWSVTLAATRCAVTHCTSSADAIRRQMGAGFPVWSIPAPVYDRHKHRAASARGWQPATRLTLDGGLVIDAGRIDIGLFSPDRVDEHGVRALRLARRAYADAAWRPQAIDVSGVVYTGVFNTADGRKNWHDLVGGFVWAFRDEPDATLILKITHADMFEGVMPVLTHISKLGRFRCRILLVHGLLSDDAYAAMVDVTSYAVNTSHGEGQCLPLMEFMSAGRPAIAPDHTAMADYVRPNNAFIVESHEVIAAWPHDRREAKRCLRRQVSFASLVAAYRESFRVARDDPARYAEMSRWAGFAQLCFCADDLVANKLREAVNFAVAIDRPTPLAARDVGLRDARLNGWYNDETGELTAGFPVSPRDVVVDVGCGEGGVAGFCGGRGAHVILVDVAGDRVEQARAHLERSRARRVDAHVVCESDPLPLRDETATRIVCNQVLEHVDDPDRLMAEMARIGRPGALYLLAVPGAAQERVQQRVGPSQYFEKPNHVRIFEADDFDALIERHGLVIERRSDEGFFWSVWWAMFWQTGADFGGSDATLDGWTQLWSDILDGQQGREIMTALDAVLPKRRVVIARKPGEARERLTDRIARLVQRMARP